MFSMMSNDIGIDLGTASILVYIKGKGVVLKEPSVVAIDRDTNKIMAIGEEARLMIGRTPGNIVAVRPLRQGVISDYTITEKMLKYFISKAVGKKTLRKPRISVCIPSGATEVEKKAVEDATYLFIWANGFLQHIESYRNMVNPMWLRGWDWMALVIQFQISVIIILIAT